MIKGPLHRISREALLRISSDMLIGTVSRLLTEQTGGRPLDH